MASDRDFLGKGWRFPVAINLTGGFHNFHPHGFVFQPIELEFQDDVNGNVTVPYTFLEDKDTIAIPGRPGAFGTTR